MARPHPDKMTFLEHLEELRQRLVRTALYLCGGFAVGWAWGLVFPINKKLWTSSYVLLTGGLAMIVFAGALLKFDVGGWRRLARPWEIFGINAIFVFVASGLLAILLARTRVGETSTHDWIYGEFFTSWIADPKLSSLAFAAATVAFWWLVLWAMARRGWTIRV